MYKPNAEWDHADEDMMINFSESGNPVFRGSSGFERWIFAKQSRWTIV